MATALGSFIWLILEPSPEPTVVFITSVLAFMIGKRKNNDYWYSKNQGDMYAINFRAEGLSIEQQKIRAKTLINNISFVCKWKLALENQESMAILYIDAVACNDSRLIAQARENLFVYTIEKNGELIHEREY